MSTSPELVSLPATTALAVSERRATPSVSAAVFAPLPAVRRGHEVTGSVPDSTVTASARAAGYAAGWAQGIAAAAAREAEAVAVAAAAAAAEREQLRAVVAAAVQALEAAAQQLRERTAPAVEEAADSVASGAVDLAEVLIGHELESADARGRATAALTRALAASPELDDVQVRLNPGDLAALRAIDPEQEIASLAGRTNVTVTADPKLASGDAVADFPGGSVDARIDTALARMRSVLRGGGSRQRLEVFDVDDL
ncbi:flagellar assembly protein FliH [Quadrisphaera granulorum]|uniref:Flagellar assembly protein FliH n=1 Tax=Quadrisphaera granulorum TaxID=317664 RepID=A0A316A4V9_9ACTN|nr:FliH/SctL family protein [Quadrisphaera granulorum]PWJ52593.1 flagellar assembly protein FliH [Quadrisphaera granulorum]SZE97643.1 flagellar assembly protein FliH [Quadrisphaera granulorum]